MTLENIKNDVVRKIKLIRSQDSYKAQKAAQLRLKHTMIKWLNLIVDRQVKSCFRTWKELVFGMGCDPRLLLMIK